MRVVRSLVLVGLLLSACTGGPPMPVRHQTPAPKAPHPRVVTTRATRPARRSFAPGSVAFWNRDAGLLSGSDSDGRCSDRCRGVIELTRDGGHTWRVVLKTRRPVTFVSTEGERCG